jgi:hypothetical protein
MFYDLVLVENSKFKSGIFCLKDLALNCKNCTLKSDFNQADPEVQNDEKVFNQGQSYTRVYCPAVLAFNFWPHFVGARGVGQCK